jgi:hypothetical protein
MTSPLFTNRAKTNRKYFGMKNTGVLFYEAKNKRYSMDKHFCVIFCLLGKKVNVKNTCTAYMHGAFVQGWTLSLKWKS